MQHSAVQTQRGVKKSCHPITQSATIIIIIIITIIIINCRHIQPRQLHRVRPNPQIDPHTQSQKLSAYQVHVDDEGDERDDEEDEKAQQWVQDATGPE